MFFFFLFLVGLISEILGTNAFYHDTLGNWLASATSSNTSWVRCYKASVDSTDRFTLSKACADKGPIVILVKAQGYIFGGFLDTGIQG